ncbi:MAG: proline--tRNA ligase [Chloroflexi bacterium]|nr:proline--tRNA ligase [Chloroflexota bacterium]
MSDETTAHGQDARGAHAAAATRDEARFVEEIVDKDENYSRWYTDVVLKAELADYAPVRGCMVIRPYGFALWENMQQGLDRRFKDTGHANAYFPLLIPESFLRKEAEHVAGFAPQVAWVTHGGDEELEERLAVRPTSETIICTMYAKWIQSWRDLPVLVNQWANVMRWEKVTRLFLRTTEFLWQEGHTAHRTEEEAEEETLRMLGVYQDFIENDLAIPVVPGRKSESEKFAGALRTYSVEALMGDGRALQAGTSHNLGQHFAKVFDITFLDKDGQRKHVWQTSWGVSTRLVGAIIMVHGDNRGLVLPPRVAPIQVIIVPIFRKEAEREAVAAFVADLERDLRPHIRVQSDWREQTPGWKFNEWELRGVPLRLEVGPRDVAANQVVAVRRDTHEKRPLPRSGVGSAVPALVEDIQRSLLDRARRFRDEHTARAATVAELEEVVEERRGFVWAPWCGEAACEAAVKERSGATIRNIPFDRPDDRQACLVCGREGSAVLFAKAY